MILNSSKNLQISGIAETEDGRLFFRAFADTDSGVAITKMTYIIESYQSSFEILRIVKEEIVSVVTDCNILILIGRFGNVYVYDGKEWQDYKIQLEPVKSIFKSIIHEKNIYAVCTGGMFACFDKKRWEIIANDVGHNNIYLIGVCYNRDNSFLVCGKNGVLALVTKNKGVNLIDIPTNCWLLDVVKMDVERFAVCGRKGTLFLGCDDNWYDYSQPDLDVNFTSMVFWHNQLFLSAKDRVLLFDGAEYSEHAEIDSLNLVGLKSGLWSIGLKKLYKFDGSNWNEMVVEVDSGKLNDSI